MVMRRFQMVLDDELDSALARRAAVEGVSKAELLRRFAREALAPLPDLERDPLWELVGADDRPDDRGEAIDVDAVIYGRSEQS